MSIENKSKRGDYILYMLVTVVGVIICSSIMIASGTTPILFSSYFGTCLEFTSTIEEITTSECVKYMEENPNSTGQDVVDYYDAQREKLLANMIEPSNEFSMTKQI